MIAKTESDESVYYTVEGSGNPFVLVHGGNCDADFMSPLAEELRDQFCCASLDRIGCRRSSRLDRDTTIEQQVRGIRAAHEACSEEPAWVFGHSSGGNFALAYALRFPSSVKGLALFEPALYALYPTDSRPTSMTVMEEEILPMFQRGDLEEGMARFAELLEFSQESFQELSLLPFAGQLAENTADFGHDQPVVIHWRPSDEELSELSVPVLLIEGDLTTRLLRDIVRILCVKVSHAQLVTLKGCDHLAPQLRPREVAQEMRSFAASP